MLIDLFAGFLNMSIATALVILLILAIRKIFSKRLPAAFAYVLWGIVLLRFVVPVSFPALFSILSLPGTRSQPVGPGGIAAAVRYLEPGEAAVTPYNGTALLLWRAASILWIVGVAALLVYGVAAYWRTGRRASTAFIIRDDPLLEQCGRLAGLRRLPGLYYASGFLSPVIIGVLRPRIILPDHLNREDTARLRHILIHECVHLKRGDHITKALFSIVLCLHWFNPLAWIACMLFDRDVEASCDERALKLLGNEQKAGYAQSLIEMSAVQNSFLQRRIAFAESSLHRRVMNIARYRPLSRLNQGLVAALVLLIGLVTVTNPLLSPDIFVPRRHAVSHSAQERFAGLTRGLSDSLSGGDLEGMLSLTERRDDYYLALYRQSGVAPMAVRSYRIYPQSDRRAYSYLTLESGAVYVAAIEGDVVRTLQTKAEFEAVQLVDQEAEPVRLIRNLHRFGILDQIATPEAIPRPAVAMLCIDEVYRDKLAAGELEPGQVTLSPQEIAQAAYDYFGIEEFSYTFDPELYDAAGQSYLYAPHRGGSYEVQVTGLRYEGDAALVTAVVYSDPLHLIPESQITYTLQKRDG